MFQLILMIINGYQRLSLDINGYDWSMVVGDFTLLFNIVIERIDCNHQNVPFLY